MGFAGAYLLKAGLREKLIEPEPYPGLKIIVTIPVYHESGLERCLDSLFRCGTSQSVLQHDGSQSGLGAYGNETGQEGNTQKTGSPFHAEVLILVNAPAGAPDAILEHNRTTYRATRQWIREHPHPFIDFHVMLDHSFGKKEAGVGLARKILMDEAVRRFSSIDRPEGIIASMDADATVESNYLEALVKHFEGDASGLRPDGCSVRFEHPLAANGDHSGRPPERSGPEKDGPEADVPDEVGREADGRDPNTGFPPELYDAIAQYELHLRYYVQAVRSTGYPYAFHTVGSSFAVNAGIYCKEGGMNRRQGGEDFYFIQKIAQRGNFSECNTTRVIPSPRPSDRVPFGTGPVVSRLMEGKAPLLTYDPRAFEMLRKLFAGMKILYTEVAMDHLMKTMPAVLTDFLIQQQFGEALFEIRRNSASYPAFQKRFWRWFNMFRIMKFLHFVREREYPDLPVTAAARQFFNDHGYSVNTKTRGSTDPVDLLQLVRQIE